MPYRLLLEARLDQRRDIERILRQRNASYRLIDVDDHWARHRDDERKNPASRPELVYAVSVGNYSHLICVDEKLFAMVQHHCYEEEK